MNTRWKSAQQLISPVSVFEAFLGSAGDSSTNGAVLAVHTFAAVPILLALLHSCPRDPVRHLVYAAKGPAFVNQLLHKLMYALTSDISNQLHGKQLRNYAYMDS